ILLIGLYYSLSIMGAGFAREGKLSPWTGIWLANISLTVLAVILLPRMEQLRGDRGWYRRISRLDAWKRFIRRRKTQARIRAAELAKSANDTQDRPKSSEGSFPRIIDLYLLRRSLGYFGLLMLTFVFLFHVLTFFELLDDIARHGVPFLVVVKY